MAATCLLVRKAFGPEQERLAHASIRSLPDRQNFAAYHFAEAKRLQKSFERKHLGDGMLLDIHTPDGRYKRVAFEVFMIKASAHAVAAIQSLHTLPDMLAHAVYYATGHGPRLSSLKERDIGPKSVERELARRQETAGLATMIGQATSGDPWRHLAAVANTSKHRSLVRASLSEDWTGKRKNFRELHVSSFERCGHSYPTISLQGLLEPEYARLSELVVDTGHALTGFLQSRAG